MKKIILSIMALTAFVSCQKSEDQTPEVDGSSEVVFTSAISTRATGTSWDEGDKIGVFMYEADAPEVYTNSESLFYTTLGGESATFTSPEPLIYPIGEEVDFVAYYPFTGGIRDGVINLNTKYQSSEEQIKALDFMVARAQKCSQNNPPALSFTRKMSKIVIKVDRKGDKADAVLSDILISNAKINSYFTISNSDNGKIVAGETTSDIVLFFNETSSTIEAIIIPQENISSRISMLIDGEPFTTTISGTFEENTQYNYNLKIDKTLNFSAGSITDWGVVESGDIESLPSFAYIEFKRNEPNTANMTKKDVSKVIDNLLAKFRRCLMTTDGSGNATICYLDNNNSTLYNDGSAAALDCSEGDVMVYFPEFWYKYENVDDDYFRYYISERAMDGYVHVEASLVGAYKAFSENNMVYSRSGVNPTCEISHVDFKSYAAARGTGYQIIDYEQHCTIAMMLYAKYLDRDTQAKLGVGDARYTTVTGTTNYIGNADTDNEITTWVNGLAIEGVFGGICEWIDGVVVDNYVWTITNPTEDNTREVTATSSRGKIIRLSLEGGDYFDMVPIETVYSDDFKTNYADYYDKLYNTECLVYRSGHYDYDYGGVASVNTNYDSLHTSINIGSRLAFRGTIVEAQSVAEYKALFE